MQKMKVKKNPLIPLKCLEHMNKTWLALKSCLIEARKN